MMAAIFHTIRGVPFIIDRADLPRVRPRRWYLHNLGYINTAINGSKIYLHRFIIGAKKGQIVDHINGNKKDCRRSNLRFCTPNQSVWNTRGRRWRYKGVTFIKDYGKWGAQIRYFRKTKWLGTFDTIEEAARAYNREARAKFGRFARLNVIT